MRSKIAQAFNNCRKQKRPALITYTVAGDNTKNNSLKILNRISKYVETNNWPSYNTKEEGIKTISIPYWAFKK